MSIKKKEFSIISLSIRAFKYFHFYTTIRRSFTHHFLLVCQFNHKQKRKRDNCGNLEYFVSIAFEKLTNIEIVYELKASVTHPCLNSQQTEQLTSKSQSKEIFIKGKERWD